MSVVRGHSKKTSRRDIIEADKASIRKGIYKVLRTGMAAMTHLLILRKSSIWPRRAGDILTVVVVDIGPWVLPLSLRHFLMLCHLFVVSTEKSIIMFQLCFPRIKAVNTKHNLNLACCIQCYMCSHVCDTISLEV